MAADPLRGVKALPFAEPLAKGSYEVRVALASGKGRKCVAAAMLCVTAQPPVRWLPATFQGRKPSRGNLPAFGVDTGTAAFMDATTEAKLRAEHDRAMDADEMEGGPTEIKLTELMLASANANASVSVAGAEGNLIAFRSGWGDGQYVSYWGLDAKGKPACLVTDFEIFVSADPTA